MFGLPPLTPSTESNFTLHGIWNKIKGIKITLALLLVMPFIFIDIFRGIPKVYILILLSSSLLLIIKK